MVFSSITFLLYFLPLFLFTYWLTPSRFKNIIILSFSIAFYSWGAPKFIFLLLTSTVVDFYLVKQLHNTKVIKRKKGILITSLLLNLGLLAYFKYANFFVENVNATLETFGFSELNWTAVVLPIGISFYTFQTLTYSIDVYRGVHKPLQKLTDYLVYILSFPQMIAGPIVRFNQIADEIVLRKETSDDKLYGFYRFCIGLAKKVLIANVLGELANQYMDGDISALGWNTAWIGLLAYTFQIYFDFSGYSDMAIGLGRMMGFHFPENFNSPYIASSVTKFWRRWHITLGEWMRNYLYIPLGGNKVASKQRLYLNLWIVFLLSGLWHGASWNFIIWGAYHGLFLILDRVFLGKLLDRIGKPFNILFTFFVVVIGWVFFKIENLHDAIIYLQKLIDFDTFNTFSMDKETGVIGILAILFSFVTAFKLGLKLEVILYKQRQLLHQSIVQTVIAMLLFVICLGAITTNGFNPFIYLRF